MNLADKIISLRKKAGWSQEELADKLDVSRQSVSKWEGAQSTPDISKIIVMSQLFGVSTDYLLKDESEGTKIDTPTKRLVTMEDAKAFLAQRRDAAKKIAAATFLCILSPVTLFGLGALTQRTDFPLSEYIAAGVGLTVLLILVAIACGLYITCGMQGKPYEFLEREEFDTEYGVGAYVRQIQNDFLPTYARCNAFGIVICILSGVPLLLSTSIGSYTSWGSLGLCLLPPIVGIGVVLFIYAGVLWASTQKLLQEGEYTPLNKKITERMEITNSIYWLLATAIYLGWSFADNAWHISWILWPVCGVLFAALSIAMRQYLKNKIK